MCAPHSKLPSHHISAVQLIESVDSWCLLVLYYFFLGAKKFMCSVKNCEYEHALLNCMNRLLHVRKSCPLLVILTVWKWAILLGIFCLLAYWFSNRFVYNFCEASNTLSSAPLTLEQAIINSGGGGAGWLVGWLPVLAIGRHFQHRHRRLLTSLLCWYGRDAHAVEKSGTKEHSSISSSVFKNQVWERGR